MSWKRALTVLAAAAMAQTVAPPPVRAQTTYTFIGGGWGHDIGMSQWGAKGLADQGKTAEGILTYYYTGTQLGTVSLPEEVRVGLVQDAGTITLSTSPLGGGSGEAAITLSFSTLVGTARPGETWTIQPTGEGRFNIDRDGARVASSVGSTGNPVIVVFEDKGTLVKVHETGFRYRYGLLDIQTYQPSSTYRLRAINAIAPFDNYVHGIAEVPSSWPAEVLKAQAIAARTYAAEKVRRLGNRRPGCECGVFDSTLDQVFSGYEKEAAAGGSNWVNAVNETRSKVVLHSGKPIQALYFSSSGGHTEHNENVWGGTPFPYLRGVPDPTDVGSPNHTWEASFSAADLEAKLNARSATAVGSLQSVEFLPPFGVSGRVVPVLDAGRGGVRIVGSDRTARASGEAFRSAAGLRSTLFRLSGAPPVNAPAPPSIAPPDPPSALSASIAGTAFRKNKPRRGVTVTISGPTFGTVKAARGGTYSAPVSPGTYTVTAARGRRKVCTSGGAQSVTVDVAQGARVSIDWQCP